MAVVGAGPAGQMAAIAAAQAGRRVVLLEQMPQMGLKLMASGGGRGNLTNLLEPAAFVAAFGRQGRFIIQAMEAMGPPDLREFLAGIGVPTVLGEGTKVFPASQSAQQVQQALAQRIEELGVAVRVGCSVSRLLIEDGQLAGVALSDGRRISAGSVALCCGGQSWPSLGGTGGGYELARQAGHSVVKPLPALVGLVTQQTWPARLAGLALRRARIWIDLLRQGKAGLTGDILLTHRGLSGPVVLDLSGTVAQLLEEGKPVPLRIELLAGKTTAYWREVISGWRTTGRRQVSTMLQGTLPAALNRMLCELAGLSEHLTVAQLTAQGREALAGMLGGLELTVTATEGFESAFVTRGGVKLKEVDPATLQSRLLPGLFLAGELLDLDGPTGGFNLQWAFASGYLAGRSAASLATP